MLYHPYKNYKDRIQTSILTLYIFGIKGFWVAADTDFSFEFGQAEQLYKEQF
jgi:hypothetical protein